LVFTHRLQISGYFRFFSPYLDSPDINFDSGPPKSILNHNSVDSQRILMILGSKSSENSWEQSYQIRDTKTHGLPAAGPYSAPSELEPTCLVLLHNLDTMSQDPYNNPDTLRTKNEWARHVENYSQHITVCVVVEGVENNERILGGRMACKGMILPHFTNIVLDDHWFYRSDQAGSQLRQKRKGQEKGSGS